MSLNKEKHSLKDKAINLSLALLTILICCLLFEGILRLSGYDPLKNLRTGREKIIQFSQNKDIKYVLVPNAKAFVFDANFKINADGYRGKKVNKQKSNKYRIISIGDSITIGHGAENKYTYSSQLEKLLNKENQEHEILNFGVGGYDIVQSISLLEAKGLEYKPDLVILGFCLNDVGIASPNLEFINRQKFYSSSWIMNLRLSQFIAVNFEKIFTGKWLESQNSSSTFYSNYKNKIEQIAEDEKVTKLMAFLPEDSSHFPHTWYRDKYKIGRMRYMFNHLKKLSLENNFEVIVLIFPRLIEFNGTYPYDLTHKIIQLELQKASLDHIDLTESYQTVGLKNLKLKPRDLIHPSPKGHSIAAHKIHKFFQNKQQK